MLYILELTFMQLTYYAYSRTMTSRLSDELLYRLRQDWNSVWHRYYSHHNSIKPSLFSDSLLTTATIQPGGWRDMSRTTDLFWSLGLWCHRDYFLRLLSVELAQTLREAQQELGLLNGLSPTRKSEQEWMDNWVWLWVVISPVFGVQERGKVGTPWANGLCSS